MISATTQGVGKTIIPAPKAFGDQLSACKHADHPPDGAPVALRRTAGFPSGQNGAEKISKPRFNARGILKNFGHKKQAEARFGTRFKPA
jgi:hypothetical protein